MGSYVDARVFFPDKRASAPVRVCLMYTTTKKRGGFFAGPRPKGGQTDRSGEECGVEEIRAVPSERDQ